MQLSRDVRRWHWDGIVLFVDVRLDVRNEVFSFVTPIVLDITLSLSVIVVLTFKGYTFNGDIASSLFVCDVSVWLYYHHYLEKARGAFAPLLLSNKFVNLLDDQVSLFSRQCISEVSECRRVACVFGR